MKSHTTTKKEYYALYFADGTWLTTTTINVGEVLHYPDTKILKHDIDVNVVIEAIETDINKIVTAEDFEQELEI